MVVFIIVCVLALALYVYLKFYRDPAWVRNAYRGKTENQKEVIRYFLIDGCLRKKWTDAEYDAYVAKVIPDLKQRGMDRIGLDEDQLKEIEPVHFENFLFETDSYQKKGADNLWRSSKYEVTWLFFSDTQVYLYQKSIYLDKDNVKERTEEYFYKDITNFSTVSESKKVSVKDGKGNVQKFDLDTTQFKLVVPGDSFLCAMEQNDYTERAIQGMKAKLREKKQS